MYIKQKKLMSKCRACGNENALDGSHRAGTQLMKQLPKDMSEIDNGAGKDGSKKDGEDGKKEQDKEEVESGGEEKDKKDKKKSKKSKKEEVEAEEEPAVEEEGIKIDSEEIGK
jgi:hypothetical protein